MTDMRRWLLARSVDDRPTPDDFVLERGPLPDPRDGEVLIEVRYHTVAPGVRAKIGRETYEAMIRPGDPIPGMGVGSVVRSNHPRFSPGALAWGPMAWATHVVVRGDALEPLDPEIFDSHVPLHAAVGVLGPSGLTAYFGLLDVAAIQPGDTLIVSAAAGSVGSIAGQIARIHGCEAVGLVGSEEKCRQLVQTFGYAGAINYRTEPDLSAAVRRAFPAGTNVYFDNVGGAVTDSILRTMTSFGRVIACGQLSDYGASQPAGWRETAEIISRRLNVRGFIVFDYRARFAEAIRQMASWMRAGQLSAEPTIHDGIEHSAKAFVSLFEDSSPSRLLVRI